MGGRGDIWELCTSIQFFCKAEPALRNKLYELKKRNLGEGCLKETNLLPIVILLLNKNKNKKWLMLYFLFCLYFYSGPFLSSKMFSKKMYFGTVVNLLIEVAFLTPSENQFVFLQQNAKRLAFLKDSTNCLLNLYRATSKNRNRIQVKKKTWRKKP